MKWFHNITTLDQLRSEYRKLAIKHHPDKGGSTVDMQEINAEYEILSKRLINNEASFTDGRRDFEHHVSETLRQKINEIISFPSDVNIEIIGRWIWVSGNTRPLKDTLKQQGFRFSGNKKSWYWYYGDHYTKLSNKSFTMDDIRNMFGSSQVEKQPLRNTLSWQS